MSTNTIAILMLVFYVLFFCDDGFGIKLITKVDILLKKETKPNQKPLKLPLLI